MGNLRLDASDGPAEYDTGMVQGELYTKEFTILVNGQPKDFTSYTGSIKIHSPVPVTKAVSFGTPTEGKVLVTLLPADTSTTCPGTYEYGIEYDNAPTDNKEFVHGKFTIEEGRV